MRLSSIIVITISLCFVMLPHTVIGQNGFSPQPDSTSISDSAAVSESGSTARLNALNGAMMPMWVPGAYPYMPTYMPPKNLTFNMPNLMPLDSSKSAKIHPHFRNEQLPKREKP
jgi:hypothetical protein